MSLHCRLTPSRHTLIQHCDDLHCQLKGGSNIEPPVHVCDIFTVPLWKKPVLNAPVTQATHCSLLVLSLGEKIRCTCLTGTEVVSGELLSGPFIGAHILMSQTQAERQEARSALNTAISSSKWTTRVSSISPTQGHPSPRTHFLSSSNDPAGGRGMASPGRTYREHWWQDDG